MEALEWLDDHPMPDGLDRGRVASQLGTLGSGNHFVELAVDQEGWIWILLHAGSRGGGNELASRHSKVARRLLDGLGTQLEDHELAWLQRGTS
jgi:tRNA-splicing ligase RtcB (3'-phosphate/5'-hydroxy nucleic acid ligase)